MALDQVGTGEHLITGSRDTTCVVWRFRSNEDYDHPLQTLYGHDSEVTCVDISTELDMAVSGARDGTCIIHTVRRGHYMHTLLPRKERHKCVVRHALISPLGRLLVYTEDKLARSKEIQCQLRPPCLHLYSVNGALISEKDLSECLNDLVIVDRFLITGNARGFLTFRDLFTLQQIRSVNLLEAVSCISVVLDHQSKHASHLLVALERGKLIIVSVGDTPPHKS
jgi:WD40 repeat protein